MCGVVLTWHVGDVVRKLRSAQGLSIEQLIVLVDPPLNKNTVSDFENDPSKAKAETFARIAEALGMTEQEIYALVPTIRSGSMRVPSDQGQSDRQSDVRAMSSPDTGGVDTSDSPRQVREHDATPERLRLPDPAGGNEPPPDYSQLTLADIAEFLRALSNQINVIDAAHQSGKTEPPQPGSGATHQRGG